MDDGAEAYIGRFAPSPTGPLHFGSLCTAVASYLDAKRARGRWHLRIDDIDPPREAPGAADAILRALERLELQWDGPVLYQSSRLQAYVEVVDALIGEGLAYRCRCSRRELRGMGTGHTSRPYPGTCRSLGLDASADAAVRLRVEHRVVRFHDRIQGPQAEIPAEQSGDFLIYRREGLPAYHLASVLDDALWGVTDVVRGHDLLEVTAAHVYLHELLGLETPRYAHVPIVVNALGQKLSKQTGATPLSTETPHGLAGAALERLGLLVPQELRGASPHELWDWAAHHWQAESLRGKPSFADYRFRIPPKGTA